MSTSPNIGASVLARLLSRAKANGDNPQLLLTAYGFERFLYRLGESPVRQRFVLKGAALLRLWSDRPYRATRDLDLLRRGDGTLTAIQADLTAILTTSVPNDGVTFDPSAVRFEAIRADDEYAGTRATVQARCSTARLSLQIDLGLGDDVWPEPGLRSYPALLDAPAPEVLVYPREAVVAEKLEALVVHGDRNSRIKDFFDLHMLASEFAFDRASLGEAVRRTFHRRRTPIPKVQPIGLTPDYWNNPSRPAQVRAFARRAALREPVMPNVAFAAVLSDFLTPILDDLRAGAPRAGTWPPGGPWT